MLIIHVCVCVYNVCVYIYNVCVCVYIRGHMFLGRAVGSCHWLMTDSVHISKPEVHIRYCHYLQLNYCLCFCCYCHNVSAIVPPGLLQVTVSPAKLWGILNWIHYLIFRIVLFSFHSPYLGMSHQKPHSTLGLPKRFFLITSIFSGFK